MKKFPSTYILLIYTLVLGLITIFNHIYPVEAAAIILRVIPSATNLVAADAVRYRIALYLSATALLVLLAPFVWCMVAKNVAKEPLLLPTWRHFFSLLILVPLVWIGYLFVGSCGNCWMHNDLIYFLMTVNIFVGLQLMIEIVFIRLKNIKKK